MQVFNNSNAAYYLLYASLFMTLRLEYVAMHYDVVDYEIISFSWLLQNVVPRTKLNRRKLLYHKYEDYEHR